VTDVSDPGPGDADADPRPPRRPKHRFRIAAAAALVALAVAARFYHLDSRPVHWDEGVHAYYAWEFLTSGTFAYDPWRHGTLLFYLTAPAMALFGESVTVGRAAVAAVSLGVFPALYLLRDDLPRPALWFAAAVLALHPFVLSTARFYRNDALLATFSQLAVGLYARALRTPNRWLGALLGVAVALALATKEIVYLVLPALVLPVVVAVRFHGRFAGRPRRDLLARYAPPRQLSAAALSLLLATLVLYGNWPPDPAGTVPRLLDGIAYWIDEGQAESGSVTYYLAFLARGTPLVFALTVVGAAGTVFRTGESWFRWVFLSWFAITGGLLSLLGDQSWWNVATVFPAVALLAGCGAVDLALACRRYLGARNGRGFLSADREWIRVTAPILAAGAVMVAGIALTGLPAGTGLGGSPFDDPRDSATAGQLLDAGPDNRGRAFDLARQRAIETGCPGVIGPSEALWPGRWWFRGLGVSQAATASEVRAATPVVVVNRNPVDGLGGADYSTTRIGDWYVYVPSQPCES